MFRAGVMSEFFLRVAIVSPHSMNRTGQYSPFELPVAMPTQTFACLGLVAAAGNQEVRNIRIGELDDQSAQ